MATCTHLDHVKVAGTPWLHLRICLECGHVGCCDSSPERHASRHAGTSGHPIMRSLEPGEDWSWCFEDQVAMVIQEVKGDTRIPPSPLG
jgi:Zn-finger in ubiquitin-hydrolases and other protein